MRKKRILKVCVVIIAFALSSSSIFAQKRIITGIISDQNGAPLTNATIRVKGEKAAVATDLNGAFKISVPVSATRLVVSSAINLWTIQ